MLFEECPWLSMTIEKAATTEGLPVSISMGPVLARGERPGGIVAGRPPRGAGLRHVDPGRGGGRAGRAGPDAPHLAHHEHRVLRRSFSFAHATPPQDHLSGHLIVVPVVGGVIVGLMARYGSKAIRGHGIPEAMEQVLLNQSRIPPRMTFLKPLAPRSPSAPAGRSAPRGRSSPPAGRSAR